MTTEQLIVVVTGLVSSIALIVLLMMARKLGELAQTALTVAGPGLMALRGQAETTLAAFGNQLKPLHDMLELLKPYVDSPDDALYKAIAGLTGWPVEAVAAAGARIWAEAEDLTDGDAGDDDPALEVISPQERTVPPQAVLR